MSNDARAKLLSGALRAAGAATHALFEALATYVDAAPAAGAPADDRWVAPTVYLRGAVPVRAVNAACGAGQIPGAVKRGKRWVARRSAVDAWLQRHQPEDAADADALLASWDRRSSSGGRG